MENYGSTQASAECLIEVVGEHWLLTWIGLGGGKAVRLTLFFLSSVVATAVGNLRSPFLILSMFAGVLVFFLILNVEYGE